MNRLRPAVTIGLLLLVLGGAALVLKGHPSEDLFIGCLFGTLFGHTALAALLAAIGPAPFIWRWPLSLVWILIIWTAATMHDAVRRWLTFDELLALGIAMLGLWIVAQGVVWGLLVKFGLSFQHVDDSRHSASRHEQQFSIRNLLALTAFVAMCVGLGRFVASSISGPRQLDISEVIVACTGVALASNLLVLALVYAAFVRRNAVRMIAGILALSGVLSVPEAVVLEMDLSIVAWTHLFAAAWALAFIVVAHLHGFRLARPTSSPCDP